MKTDDPYRTPVSDVEVFQAPSKTRWKVFFWLILVLEVLSVGMMLSDPGETLAGVGFEVIVYSTILAGLFGYAYGRKFLFPRFWLILIPAGLAYDLYAFYRLDWTWGSQEEMYFSLLITAIIVLPILYFQYTALYRYALKSADIWK